MSAVAANESPGRTATFQRPPLEPPKPAPFVEAPQPLPTRPSRTPPQIPTMFKPNGSPVPALTQLGYWGSIHDFNDAVAQTHQNYVAANGVPPDSKTMLGLAVQHPVGTLGKPLQVVSPVPTNGADVKGLLGKLVGAAGFGEDQRYQDFVHQHSDVLQGLLRDPVTHAQTMAAFNASQVSLHFRGANPDATPPSFTDVVKGGAHAVAWAADTSAALGKDLGSLLATTPGVLAGHTRKVDQAASFPHLTRVAPAVAQVVKGLAYSPVGVAMVAEALAKDYNALSEYVATSGDSGSPAFTHTAALAKKTGSQMWQDMNDPGGRAGYLLLDVWGALSLGAGTAARLGRVGSALGEEGAVGARLAAAGRETISMHPLKTATYSKGGYAEQISLSGSPLTAWVQEHAPMLGTNAQQARLAGDAARLPAPPDRLSQWASSILSPEARMGRAGNIRRSTETKALSALAAKVSDAAGWSARQTWLDSVLPDNHLTGLSRGEVKAIQALSWDDPNPIMAEERFHQAMIESGVGDRAAHLEQIANLALARKALANPSPRFTATLEATQKAVAEAQRIRLEHGLPEPVAEARIAKAGAILRGEDVVSLPEGGQGIKVTDPTTGAETIVPLNRQTEDSWYTPTVMKGKPKKQIGANVTLPASQYGIGPPGLTVWDTHTMSGDALRSGDIRIDAHNLAGEGLARTAKAAVQWDGWTKAWEHATPERQSPEDIVIRDVRSIPDNVRKAVTEFQDGHISNQAVDDLPPDLVHYLFPDETTIAPNEHVRYVDPRMLGNLTDVQMRLPGPIGKFMETINNALRPLILYGPKYSLNLLGNESMLVFDQGFIRSSQNLAKAMSADKWALEDDHARMQSLSGAAKSGSYVTAQSGRFSKGLADFWSKITDSHFRMASHLYYMDKAGFRTPAEIHDLLTNPEHAQTLTDITKRGDDAMVAFDRFTPFEKGVLRHIIFVYPWQRGSLIWSFRSIFEHPAKSALLATLGQEAYTEDPQMKQMPAWVRRTGYIPFHWENGQVSVLNPSSVNTFGTLGQLVATAKGAVMGDPYAGLGDWFGPAGQFISHASSGVDSNGNAYKGSQIVGAIMDTLNMLPELASYRRSQKGTGQPLKPYDVANRTALLTRLNSALKETTLDPGWLDGYGSQLAGGFSPRHLSLTAVTARYWSTAPPKVKQQHEVDLILRQLALQAQFLKTGMPDDATITRMMLAPLGSMEVKGQVPADVRQAVIDASQLAYSNQLDQKKLGRNWTAKEKLLNTIRYFRSAGRMSGATAKQLTTLAHSAEALPDLRHQEAAVHAKYGNLQALHDWGQDVSLAASFTQKANVDARTVMLNANGLAVQPTYMLTDPERAAYGRAYTKYTAGRREIGRKFTGAEKTAALLTYDDQHSQPTKLGSRSLPSVAALRLSDGPSDVAQQQIVKASGKSWGSLSTVEKAALGRKIPAGVSDGWKLYRESVLATRKANNTVTADDRKQIAAYVQKNYPGFMQDYLYAGKPKVERFQASPVYKTMPDKATFDLFARNALLQARAMQSGNATHADARRDWKKYIVEQVQPWLARDHPELAAWLKPLGTNWLTGLINSG